MYDYDLTADAWIHEVTALDGAGALWLVVPDETPDDAPFTPRKADAFVKLSEGELPLAIVERLWTAAKSAGDFD